MSETKLPFRERLASLIIDAIRTNVWSREAGLNYADRIISMTANELGSVKQSKDETEGFEGYLKRTLGAEYTSIVMHALHESGVLRPDFQGFDVLANIVQPGQSQPLTSEQISDALNGLVFGREKDEAVDAILSLVRRAEQALQPTRVTITVNMREHQVEGGAISYERVAELAGKPGASHLTISYERGGAGGTLIPGESAPLSDGMHFCATNTSNA